MMSDSSVRAFFTSVPKCGKNLIYSMFAGLGFSRYDLQSADRCARAAYFERFDRINYVYPPGSKSEDGGSDLLAEQFASDLRTMPARTIFHRHLLPTPAIIGAMAQAGIAPVMVIRDPRDTLLSAAHYAIEQDKPSHICGLLPSRQIKDVIGFLLRGDNGTATFAAQYDAYLPWTQDPNTLVVRFEDIVGEQGGADRRMQETAVRNVLGHIGLDPEPETVGKAVAHLFNPKAGTFRSGRIGSWAQMRDAELDAMFEQHAGSVLDNWGYR